MSDSRAVKLSEIILPRYQSLLGGERIKLDGITIFTGPNSAGKSAVLDFIKQLGAEGMSPDWLNDPNEFCLSFLTHIGIFLQ
jgi:predicted ATPase